MTTIEIGSIITVTINALTALVLFVRIGRLLESHDNLTTKVKEHIEDHKFTDDVFKNKLERNALAIGRLEATVYKGPERRIYPMRDDESGPSG